MASILSAWTLRRGLVDDERQSCDRGCGYGGAPRCSKADLGTVLDLDDRHRRNSSEPQFHQVHITRADKAQRLLAFIRPPFELETRFFISLAFVDARHERNLCQAKSLEGRWSNSGRAQLSEGIHVTSRLLRVLRYPAKAGLDSEVNA